MHDHFVLGQEGPEILINDYNVEIKAVRNTQIIDDVKILKKFYHGNKVNKRRKFKVHST